MQRSEEIGIGLGIDWISFLKFIDFSWEVSWLGLGIGLIPFLKFIDFSWEVS